MKRSRAASVEPEKSRGELDALKNVLPAKDWARTARFHSRFVEAWPNGTPA